MATLSQVRTLPPSPPSSIHRGNANDRSSWDFAVPLHHGEVQVENNNSHSHGWEKSVPIPNSSASRVPLQPRTNDIYRGPSARRVDTGDSLGSARTSQDQGARLLSVRPENLRNLSGTASDRDSLLDLYNRSRNASYNHGTTWPADDMANQQVIGGQGSPEEIEDNWIHRDKLAQIESKELEEAGFRVRGRTSRSGSRGTSQTRGRQREGSLGAYNSDTNGEERPGLLERRKKKWVSPVPAEDEEDEAFNPDPRTPQEIAADEEAAQYSTPGSKTTYVVRPGTSRIPVAKNSPAPVPNPLVERDAPLIRSRNGSGAWAGLEDSIAYSRARARSGSIGSQVLLDDFDTPTSGNRPTTPRTSLQNGTSPNGSSPKKVPVPKSGPTSKKTGTRVTSNSRTRNASGQSRDSPNKRPGTSGGRPSTGHRPEGEAPWIATMYKPDPRLPPDQQMLPTHAKRMAQEQWEREGKTGSIYDKDFNLLTADDFPTRTSSREPSQQVDDSIDSIEVEGVKEPETNNLNPNLELLKDRDSTQWPLVPTPNMSSERTESVHGGYSTLPKLTGQSPPLRQQSSPKPITNQRPSSVHRIPEPPEEKPGKKEKGCCGCVVM